MGESPYPANPLLMGCSKEIKDMKYRFVKTGKVYELQLVSHKDNKSGYARMFRNENEWFNLDWPQFGGDKVFKPVKNFSFFSSPL